MVVAFSCASLNECSQGLVNGGKWMKRSNRDVLDFVMDSEEVFWEW